VCREEEDGKVNCERDKEEEGNQGLLNRRQSSLSFPFSLFLPSLCLYAALAAVISVV
jgi:hypothetical protein